MNLSTVWLGMSGSVGAMALAVLAAIVNRKKNSADVTAVSVQTAISLVQELRSELAAMRAELDAKQARLTEVLDALAAAQAMAATAGDWERRALAAEAEVKALRRDVQMLEMEREGR